MIGRKRKASRLFDFRTGPEIIRGAGDSTAHPKTGGIGVWIELVDPVAQANCNVHRVRAPIVTDTVRLRKLDAKTSSTQASDGTTSPARDGARRVHVDRVDPLGAVRC